MTNKELKGRLARALEHTAPDRPGEVLSRCPERKGTVIQMTRTVFYRRNMIAACLALAVMAGGGAFWQQTRSVASVVSLDVNPSIELKVNRREKVLACEGLNQEAREVLSDMDGGRDLEGTRLPVAVNAIVGALVGSGYLEDLSSAILISVEDGNADRAARLQQQLTASVDDVLHDRAAQAAVLSQRVTADSALEQQARDNSISTGKAALIGRVIGLNGGLKFEELAALSVEELRDLIELGAPAMPIGRQEARLRAEEHLAGQGSRLTVAEVDPELDDRTPHYEVELRLDGRERDVHVHAFTGEILTAGTPAAPGSPQTPVIPDEYVPPVQQPTQAPTQQAPVQPPRQPETKAPQQPATQPPRQTDDIGADRAKAIALSHAGLTESQVRQLKAERDRDDGRLEYEIEFKSGGIEYEYTVDGVTGAVLEHEAERDD